MFKMNGTDNYTDHFDFFKWSAPVYETPKEVVAALRKIDFKNKQIESIRCIGTAEIIGLQSHRLYNAIKNAGIKPGNEWQTQYPYLSDMPIERKVELCEPIQIVFSDGTTFEFMPMSDGGARFAQNSIPQNIVDGINKNNIDLNAFMGAQIQGRTIESCEVQLNCFSKTSYNYSSCMETEKPYTEKRTSYRYVFSLAGLLEIVAEMDWVSYFTVELDLRFRCDTLPYAAAQACTWPVDQIYITAGRDGGGTFWIIPTHSEDRPYEKKHNISDYDNCGMSIEEDDVGSFLTEFLGNHFDQSIQDPDREEDGFDWNGINLYSRKSMREIVSEVRDKTARLKTDLNSPACQRNEAYQKHIAIAIDFYSRFAERIESMLAEQPDCDVISFAGP